MSVSVDLSTDLSEIVLNTVCNMIGIVIHAVNDARFSAYEPWETDKVNSWNG